MTRGFGWRPTFTALALSMPSGPLTIPRGVQERQLPDAVWVGSGRGQPIWVRMAQPTRRGADAGGGGGGPRSRQPLSPPRDWRAARCGNRAGRCRARYAGGTAHEAADDSGAAPRYAASVDLYDTHGGDATAIAGRTVPLEADETA